jgi:hypothetical protein
LTAATGFSEQFEKNTSFDNFVNALRSPKTRRGYVYSLKKYMNHLKLTDVEELIKNSPSLKVIEAQLIDYIMSLRQDGLSHATVKYLVAPIFTFYQLNDVVLNRKKVNRYFGEYKRVMKDKAYTTEQIGQSLQNADSVCVVPFCYWPLQAAVLALYLA